MFPPLQARPTQPNLQTFVGAG